jgi:hypothetical protein
MNEMMDNKNLQEQVLLFLNEITSIEIDSLSINNSLEIDLGISGNDASDLIAAFAERFKVLFCFHPF